jgi:hypothetical protein
MAGRRVTTRSVEASSICEHGRHKRNLQGLENSGISEKRIIWRQYYRSLERAVYVISETSRNGMRRQQYM